MKKIVVVYSRGLADRAKKHVEYLKTAETTQTIIDLLPKLVKVYNDKGEFRSEVDILAQKLDIIKAHDEVHVLWDGTDPDAAVLIGMGLALDKEVVSYYVAPIGIRKYLWEVRAKGQE
jgi:hypothetical protein